MCTHVQACFDQRIKAWQRWQDAVNMLQKKRETEAKLLWANKPDKLQQAKDEITEVKLTGKPYQAHDEVSTCHFVTHQVLLDLNKVQTCPLIFLPSTWFL